MNQLGLEPINFVFSPSGDLKAGLIVSLLSVWVLVGVFYYLNHYTKRRYFSIWAVAWLFYALHLTLRLGAAGQNGMRAAQPTQSVLMLEQWCISVSAVFLLWGSMRFLGQRMRQVLFGLFLVFLFVWSYIGNFYLSDLRRFHSQVPIFGLIGFSSVVTGWGFYHYRKRRSYIGAGLLAFGFCLWGLHLMIYPVTEYSQYRELQTPVFFVAAVLQLFIAVSMIILVLEQLRFVNDRRARWQLKAREQEKDVLRGKVTSTEERYRILFEVASEAIIITVADDLKIIEMNQAAERILGLSQAEVAGQSLTAFCAATHPAGPLSQSGEDWFNFVCRERFQTVTRKDGNSVPVEIDGSKVDYAGLPAFQFFFREITERARLEQQLRHAEKLSALGQMISGVAHELNNPLAVIKGFVELVLNHHEISPRTRANLEKAAQETNRAARLVRNLLSMSRHQPDRREAVDLNDIVNRIVELRKMDFLLAEIECHLELAPDLPLVCVDPDQIQQVIIILINNALQALVGPHRPGRLHFRTQHLQERVRLTVEDSGSGVPPHLRTKIFAPFFTTKPAGIGTGLGLSIAYGILTEHRGRIFYESSSLGGAGFVIELPVDPTARLETVPVNALAMAGREEVPLARRTAKVLVLDDEPALAELLVEMITLLGHEPVLCQDGQRGLELIAESPFDLVFSDYHMPAMNGRQFYEAVTQQRPEMKNRFVFLTGDVLTKETQIFLDSLGSPCLSKPFSLDQVQKIINTYLDKLPTA